MFASQSKFAELKGVSPAAVCKAISAGRLRDSVKRGPDGRVKEIDVLLANKEWDENTDHSKSRRKPAPLPADMPKHQDDMLSGELPSHTSNGNSAALSKKIFEDMRAKNAQLDYEQRIGKLLEAEKVKREAFSMARALRDALLNIPDRLASELSGISDQHTIHQRMTEEIRMALEGIVRMERDANTAGA